MRRILLSIVLVGLCVSVVNAAERRFSYTSGRSGQGVSLEIIDRFTIRLAVSRPDYTIAPTVIRLTQPIALDRSDVYHFVGRTAFEGGTLRVRGRLLTQGTANKSDDLAFLTWSYSNPNSRNGGEGESDDDEIMESDDG